MDVLPLGPSTLRVTAVLSIANALLAVVLKALAWRSILLVIHRSVFTMALAWHGKQIIIRNTNHVSDFTYKRGSPSLPRKKKVVRRRSHIYFHVHLEEEDVESTDEDNHSSGEEQHLLSDDGKEDTFATSLTGKSTKYKGELHPQSMYIDKRLPANIKQDLKLSCKRMGWTCNESKTPEAALIWWCSDRRDKSMSTQKRMASKLNVSHKLTRVNFFCGTRFCLEKKNLQSKLEVFSLLLGTDAFDFMPESYVLPRHTSEFERVLQRNKGKTRRVKIEDLKRTQEEEEEIELQYKQARRQMTRAARKRAATRLARETATVSSTSEEDDGTGTDGSSDGSNESGGSISESDDDADASDVPFEGSRRHSGSESDASSGVSSAEESGVDSDGFPVVSSSDGETEKGSLPSSSPPRKGKPGHERPKNAAKTTSKTKPSEDHAGIGAPPSPTKTRKKRRSAPRFKDVCDEDVYIVKPSTGKRGDGIALFQGVDGWKRLKESHADLVNNCVIQRYVADPFLLQDGCKFDLRLYVLLESLMPLKAYLCTEGMARFATIPYQQARSGNLHRRRMHLTNYSINRGSSFFAFSESVLSPEHEENKGSKRTLTSVLAALRSMGRDTAVAMRDVRRLIARTCASMQAELIYIQQRTIGKPADQNKGFHLIGFDIMWNTNLKPFLLEVNAHPSLRTDFAPTSDPDLLIASPIDQYIKQKVVDGALSILAQTAARKLKKSADKKKTGAAATAGTADAEDNVYYYEKVRFDSESMTLIRVGKQMLNLFGELCNGSTHSDLDKTSFCRFFQMVALLKKKTLPIAKLAAGKEPPVVGVEALRPRLERSLSLHEGSVRPQNQEGSTVASTAPLSGTSPTRASTAPLEETSSKTPLGFGTSLKLPNREQSTPPKPAKPRLRGESRVIPSGLTYSKLESLFDRTIIGEQKRQHPRRASQHQAPPPRPTHMTYPEFCRALFEVASLAAPKKNMSVLESVGQFLDNIEARTKEAEKQVQSSGSPATTASSSRRKTRTHSLGQLFSMQQRKDDEKARRLLEKQEKLRKEEGRKLKAERGQKALERVQIENRKRRKKELAEEMEFLLQIKKEKEKQRRQSEFDTWMSAKKTEQQQNGKEEREGAMVTVAKKDPAAMPRAVDAATAKQYRRQEFDQWVAEKNKVLVAAESAALPSPSKIPELPTLVTPPLPQDFKGTSDGGGR